MLISRHLALQIATGLGVLRNEGVTALWSGLGGCCEAWEGNGGVGNQAVYADPPFSYYG